MIITDLNEGQLKEEYNLAFDWSQGTHIKSKLAP